MNIPEHHYSKHYKTASIEYDELKVIIAKIVAKFKNTTKQVFKPVEEETEAELYLTNIKSFLLENINTQIKEYLLTLDITILNDYKILNTRVLHSGENATFYNHKFVISIFRFGTFMYYNIYFDILYEKLKNKIVINSANILGTTIKNGLLSEVYNKCILDGNKCNLSEECSNNCNLLVSNDPNYKKKLDLFIKHVTRENLLLKESNLFNCYKKDGDSFIIDYKIDKKTLCDASKGVWDRPCLTNADCPFYTKNDNRGGCRRSQCRFPWGITVLSPRTYTEDSVPFCNGCVDNTYRCCKTQSPPNYIFKESN